MPKDDAPRGLSQGRICDLIDGLYQAAALALINTRIVKMTGCCLWRVTDINYGRGLILKMCHWFWQRP